jgi:hypothetical protein
MSGFLRALLNRVSDAIDNANGDVVEAMHGHAPKGRCEVCVRVVGG